MAATAEENRRGREGLKVGFTVLSDEGFGIRGSREWNEGKIGEVEVKDFRRVDRDEEEEEEENPAMAAILVSILFGSIDMNKII